MRHVATLVLLASLGLSACDRGPDRARGRDEPSPAGAADRATSDASAPRPGVNPADSETEHAKERQIESLPGYREVTVPAGTRLSFRLQTPLASDTSAVEDPVRATLRTPVRINDVEALSAGAPVSGVVTSAKRSARVKGRASMAFRFTSITVNDEPLVIRTSAIRRQARGTKARDAKTIGIPAAGGAIVGGVVGGKKGAAIGGAAAGGAGTAVVLSTRGQEIRLPAGTLVSARLEAPLTVRVPVKSEQPQVKGR